MVEIRPWAGTYVVDQWESSYIPAEPKYNTKCMMCGKPAEWVDVFAEAGVCGETCARALSKMIDDAQAKFEKENCYE